MIPGLLKISGFLSYLEPVELDFSSFELACISGANGAGKSSLLDAITWVLFGQARRKDDALINSRADSAEVILDFYYENNFYRVQRSKARGKSNSLEFFIRNTEGNWKLLTEHSLRETENHIQNTLRLDYETFTNVSFFLQGKADQFAQQRPGDRKRILGNILGLETWETYREKTSQTRRQSENNLAVLTSQLEDIQNELEQENERRSHLKNLENDLEKISETRTAQQTVIENIRQLRAAVEERKLLVRTMFDQFQASKQRLQSQLEKLHKKQEEFLIHESRIDSEKDVEKAYEQLISARQELQKWESIATDFRHFEQQRSKPLMDIETEKARLEQQCKSLYEKQEQASHAADKLKELQMESQTLREELAQLTKGLEKHQKIELELQTAIEELSQTTANNKQLRKDMNELKERIDRLKDTGGASCPLCEQPLPALERDQLVERLEADGKEMGDRFRQNLNRLSELGENKSKIENEIKDSREIEENIRQKQRLLDQFEQRIEHQSDIIKEWEDKHSAQCEQITRTLEENTYAMKARAELAEIDQHLKQLGYDTAAHDAVRQIDREGNQIEEKLRMLQVSKAAMQPLKKVIDELEKQTAADEAVIKKQEDDYLQAEQKMKEEEARLPDLAQAENDLFAIQEKENRLRTEIGGAVQRVEVLKSLKKRKTELSENKEETNLYISRLKTLERAFSTDGIPALLIEQALPEIEEQANRFLDRLSGGKMTVRFLTQRDYKNKNRQDKKETLDILISDSAGTREYEMFSGGESFRINFAIRLALSQVLSQRAGARLQTLVIDEGFGNQDNEGRQRLLEALNIVRPDFEKILVITHIEELKEAFPARIEIEKNGTGSRLRVIS